MTRLFLLAVIAGCSTSEPDIAWAVEWLEPQPHELDHVSSALTHRSTAWAQTTGLAPRSDAETSWVAMTGAVCAVAFANGEIGLDTNPDEENQEEITDNDDDRLVAITPDHLHVITPGFPYSDDHAIPGVRDGRLTDDGIVVLRNNAEGDCEAAFDLDPEAPRSNLPPEACDNRDGVAVDPHTSEVWVSTDTGTQITDPSGTRPFPGMGDLLAVDPELKIAYTATYGDADVSAWSYDGAALWTVDVGGPIVQLRAMPARASVGVLVDSGGERTIVQLSAATGGATVLLRSPEYVQEFAASADGRRFMVATWAQVDFFVDKAQPR